MSDKRRAGRSIKVEVTENISHMGVSEEEYEIIEDYYERETIEDSFLTPKDEEFVLKESKLYNIEEDKLRKIILKYKQKHNKAI